MSAAARQEGGRPRSAKRMLGAALLSMHLFVVLFAMLAIFGLRLIEPLMVLVLGGGLALVCLLAMVLIVIRPGVSGYLLGWVAQALTIAAGFIAPSMFLVGAVFALIWGVGMYWGTRIDRERAAWEAGDSPEA